jgi:hypothetical protein
MKGSVGKRPALPPLGVEHIAAFRDAAKQFATATPSGGREASIERLTALWMDLRDRAEVEGKLSKRFPGADHVTESLGAAMREEDPKKRAAASDALVTMLERIHNGLAAAGTPAEPGARWRPDEPVLPAAQKAERLKQARKQARGTARSLVDAVRKVVAARRENGVPLYSTYSNEVRAHYAAAATDYEFGLVPQAPFEPGLSKRTAPWGVFKVQLDIPPGEAADRFATSPPLPARSELLQARWNRIQLTPLHQPAGADARRADDEETPHATPR